MFDISWGEFIVVGIVALIVIGPQQLPGALRGLGRTINKLRTMAGEFRGQFDEAMREAEMQDVAKGFSDIKSAASGGFNPVDTIRNEIRSAVDGLKEKVTGATGASEVQSALDDVNSTLKAAEYDLKTAALIDGMVAPPASANIDVAPLSALDAQISAPQPEVAPTKAPRRKKADAKPTVTEGETE